MKEKLKKVGKIGLKIILVIFFISFLNWGIKFNKQSKDFNNYDMDRQFIEERIDFLNTVIEAEEGEIIFDYMKGQGITKTLAEKELMILKNELEKR